MRVLTVRQPWAWAIIHGGKTIENRSRNVAGKYRDTAATMRDLGRDFADSSCIILRNEARYAALSVIPRPAVSGEGQS